MALSGNFDGFKEILVQVDKAVLDIINWDGFLRQNIFGLVTLSGKSFSLFDAGTITFGWQAVSVTYQSSSICRELLVLSSTKRKSVLCNERGRR